MTCLCVLCNSVLYLEPLGQLAVVFLYIQGRSDVRAVKFNSCHHSCGPFSWFQQTLHCLLIMETYTNTKYIQVIYSLLIQVLYLSSILRYLHFFCYFILKLYYILKGNIVISLQYVVVIHYVTILFDSYGYSAIQNQLH